MKLPARATVWIVTGGILLTSSVLVWDALHSPATASVGVQVQANSITPGLRRESARAPAVAEVSAGKPMPVEAKSWRERWAELERGLNSPQRNHQRAMLLKELAASDPQRAIALARLERNDEVRPELFRALLEGWATRDLAKAGEWAMDQNDLHHDLAMSAVFNGAGAHPDAALLFAQQLSERFPERAQDYGSYLVFSLGRAGAYEQAADFATEGDSLAVRDWIISAYGTWARHQPEAAVLAATDLGDPEKRSTAFRAAIYAWAQTDPKALVEYAGGFPAGDEKSFALIAALRAWRQREPHAAKAWIAKAGPIPGIATVDED